jgi:hypothetical protein
VNDHVDVKQPAAPKSFSLSAMISELDLGSSIPSGIPEFGIEKQIRYDASLAEPFCHGLKRTS